jgi:acetyl/propionyl-CoA carboxylase alpha subunit
MSNRVVVSNDAVPPTQAAESNEAVAPPTRTAGANETVPPPTCTAESNDVVPALTRTAESRDAVSAPIRTAEPNTARAAYRARIADRDIVVQIAHRRPKLRLQIDGTLHTVVENPGTVGAFELAIDGVVYRGWRYAVGNDVYVRLGARTFIVSCADGDPAAGRVSDQQYETRADMPGVVVALHCEAGQAVRIGDPLVTIESMKLQATLVAGHDAVVAHVHAGPETPFERGAVLVSFVRPLDPQGPS